MKKITSFLIALAIGVLGQLSAQTWSEPLPVGSPITSGSGYYVYNVGVKAFLDRGGDWATQAITFKTDGALITPVLDAGLYTLQFEDATKTLFCSEVANGSLFTDGNGNNSTATNNQFEILLTNPANNVYSIQTRNTFAGYNASQYVGTSATAFNSNTGTVYDVRFNRAASTYTQWIFCTPAETARYNAKVKLDGYMKIAKLIGSSIDLTPYISIYNSGSASEISSAAANLNSALAPTDKTSAITNPSFDVAPTTGWTFTTGYGYNNAEVEYYGKTFDINQTVTSLPSGVYILKAQGFERPAGLNATMQTWWAKGWDGRNEQLYATASGTTTSVSVRSIFSETASPAGSTVGDFKYPNSMSDAASAFGFGLYDNELSYFVVDATGTAKIGMNATYRSNGNYTEAQWCLLDNFRLFYYGSLAVPNLSVSETSIFLSDAGSTSKTFTVTGSNLTSGITITAPAGITLSGNNLTNNGSGNYTISQANGNNSIVITATWDGVASISGNITITTNGVTAKTITVGASKDNGCFTPLYPTLTNLIPDPKFNSISAFGCWGNTSIATGSEAYCGYGSGKITGTALCYPNGGSIGTAAITWVANHIYKFRAMVKTTDGTFNMGIQNANVNGGSGDFNIEVPNTSGVWTEFTTTFTAGSAAGSGVAFFNNCGNSTGMVGYIDNWELYDITDISTGNSTAVENKFYVTKSSDNIIIHGIDKDETVYIYSASGQLIKSIGFTDTEVSVRLNPGVYLIKAKDKVVKVLVNNIN